MRERITRPRGAQQQPHGEDAEQQRDDGAQHKAEFLTRHREDEIGMGIGDAIFDRASTGPHARETAMLKSLQRQPRLIARFAGIFHLRDILIDTVADVREEHIGESKKPRARARKRAHPIKAQACEKEKCGPQREQQPRLADIRLQHQKADGQRHQKQGDEFLADRHGLRIGKQGGRQYREARLEEFGWLKGEPAQIDPAFCAEHFVAREQHQRRTDNGEREHDGRDKLDGADGKDRGDGQDAGRDDREGDLLGGIAEIARGHRPAGGRRARREGQHQADGDQGEHGDEGDAIHRPPPACETAASGARERHWAASLCLTISATSVRKTSPRCSKSRN